LGLAARAECGFEHLRLLAQQADQLKSKEWTEVVSAANTHRLAPLLYVHLQAAGVDLPATVEQELVALYLRSRWHNRIRLGVLPDVLRVYQAENIRALVLKGAALSQLVYPEPGLRPMNDLDILVPKSEVVRAQRLLTGLGFEAPLPSRDGLPDKHMAQALLHVDGLRVFVEVHYKLFSQDNPVSMDMDGLSVAPLAFSVPPNGITAYTLGYEDMLWHLCRHLGYSMLFGQSRLIWMADIISFAERFASEIDWDWIERQYAFVLEVLSVLHFTTPLSDKLLSHAPLKIGRAPQGIGEEFQGWPKTSMAIQRQKGIRRFLSDTFFPSEWWVRLYYGVGTSRSITRSCWLRHPLHIFGWIWHWLLGRLNWFKQPGESSQKQ
jgi:hypothetical protein